MKLPLNDKKFIFLLTAVLISVVLEILSLADVKIPMPYAPFVFAVFILGIGYEVLWGGLKALGKLNFGSINLLMLIAVCAAFYLGEYSEAAVVIVLFVLGERLEDIGIGNSMSALDNLTSKAPKTAWVKSAGELLPIDTIVPGTIIQIKPHDLIPLDGIVESGETSVDESSITGEPIPNNKIPGDTVFAGTLNKNGFIEVKTTKTANDTTFAKIVELTYEAQSNKSDAQKFIQRFASIYTPVIIVLAVLIFVIPVFVFGLDVDHWLKQAVTLLVISCPCALVISIPVAVYAAIGNASAGGALIKGGKYLETMGAVRVVGMDKTRTITYGNPVVSDVIPLNGTSREELLACSAGTELFSEHPLAQAIVDASNREGYKPHVAGQFESVVGKGTKAVCSICDHSSVLVGKPDFIRQHHVIEKDVEDIIERLSAQGKTCVVVSCNHEITGVIALTDEIKPESGEVIRQLKSLGVDSVVITGDNNRAAHHVASQLGVDAVYSELLPQDKVEIIKKLQSEYKYVAMVGDGVNDAPALAEADVGIAMGAAGSDTAIEIADIALMNDKLSLIPFLIRLGRKTTRIIKGNTIGAIAVKIIFILPAFFGSGNLVLAITADVGVTLAVILISLRLMNFK
ncbi:MAG: cation-translocating P-type ATPase [Candidatus Azobacteroides sp.]|nr:cation-translocating P-type ATPase [Candidatus Azobacteroides sp.]